MLRDLQAKKVADKLNEGQLTTGRGQNQEQNLQALSTTRWNCQLDSVENLRDMFDASMEVVEWASTDASDSEKRAEALMVYERATSFEFTLCMFLMIKILSATNSLSQCLQRKDQDILNALRLVRMTKRSLQMLQNSGWDGIKKEAIEFCEEHGITVPSLNEIWVARGRPRRLPAGHEPRTVEDHFRIDLFNAVVDSTLAELNHRFSSEACELLSKVPFLDPVNNFESYALNQKEIVGLAAMYTADFREMDLTALKKELTEFVMFTEDEENATVFEPVKSNLKQLSVAFCKHKLVSVFPQLFKLIRLVLTLPISTASTERAFSAMKILKTRLRTTMGDDWLVDLMVIYVERAVAKSLDIKDIVNFFMSMSARRVQIQ
jgi:hAT family C-terminal dimerisation region